MNIAELQSKTNAELHELAKEYEVAGYSKMRKQQLIMELLRAETEREGLIFAEGVLEVLPDGYGFLPVDGYTPGPDDVYVSPSQIRRFNLSARAIWCSARCAGPKTASATTHSCVSRRSTCGIPRKRSAGRTSTI